MANFSAAQAINQASPLIKSRVDQSHGRIRLFESLYAAPASGTAPAIADKIIWGTLPLGAVLLTHLAQMAWNTGTASCTLNLGDSCVAAKHLAATAITTTGTATPSVATLIKTCVADVESGSFILSNIKGMGALTVGDLVTGTGIPAALGAALMQRGTLGETPGVYPPEAIVPVDDILNLASIVVSALGIGHDGAGNGAGGIPLTIEHTSPDGTTEIIPMALG